MKVEGVAAAVGWLSAISLGGQQITQSGELFAWLAGGALTGAATAVLFPSTGDAPAWRKLAGSALAAIILTFVAFEWAGWDATTDRVFMVSSVAGFLAWLAVPILQRGGLSKLRDAIGGKRQ